MNITSYLTVLDPEKCPAVDTEDGLDLGVDFFAVSGGDEGDEADEEEEEETETPAARPARPRLAPAHTQLSPTSHFRAERKRARDTDKEEKEYTAGWERKKTNSDIAEQKR